MPRFEPTDEQRQIVEKASDVDLPHEHICQLAPRTGRGIDRETLRSAFRLELNRGRARAGQAVANALYNNAVNSNNVAAQIWWSKAAHGWSEIIGHQLRIRSTRVFGRGRLPV
jgi:primase-polymerase (primpol)-like protein